MAEYYRNLDNQEYWIKRSQEQVDQQWKNIKNVEKELATQYRLSLEDIRQMVADLYTKYATEQGLSYQDAVRNLTSTELGDYQSKIKRLRNQIQQTDNPFLIAEYEKLMNVVKLNRLQALMGQIEARLLQHGYEQQMTIEQHLSGVYEGNYYATLYMLSVGTGYGASFSLLNEDAITQAIVFPWSGEQFSDRIWTNKAKLVSGLRRIITQGLIKGESVQKMARNLRNEMDGSYKNALRLVRTETAYVIGESTAKGYKDSGIVKRYVYISTLDSRTSTVCQRLDNKVFNLDDRQVGVNASPMHPNCRSTEAPYFGDMKDSSRIAKGDDGQKYYVPASMSYNEWKKQYLK